MKHWRPALFLDRDGVINVDHGYVHQCEHFHFIPGIFKLVTAANHCGYRVVVVTNQAGISRGFYSEEIFADLTRWMIHRFMEEGACIDAVYHCPHHPTEGLGANMLDCNCRKPQPGLLLQAIDDLAIAAPHSILIGDKPSDLVAGQRAGIRHLFLFNHHQLPAHSSDLPEDALAISNLLHPFLLDLIHSYQPSQLHS